MNGSPGGSGRGAAIAFLLSVGSVLLGGCASAARDDTSSSGTQRATFGQFTLQYPDAWHAVDPTFATGALFAPIGWITNRQPGPQCTPDPATGHIGCHAPVDQLDEGDLLVTLTETGGAPVGAFHADSTFAGLPAQRTAMTNSECFPSGQGGVDLLVEEPERFLRLQTCFGPDSATARAQVQQMIASAIYQRG